MSKKDNKDAEKKKKKKHIILKLFLSIVSVTILYLVGFVIYSTYKNGWGLSSIIQTAIGDSETKLEDLDPFTVLIMGVSEDISSKLTDTIIVASYNPKTQKASLISIPRDTFVGTNKSKANSYDKINALYQKSPEKTLAAVNKITGLNIVYYVVISNNALVQLVDTIGGVEFDVPIDMNYDDSSQDLYIHLKKGKQKLTGEQAEWLVRFRKNNNGTSYPSSYGDNDLGRMRTQREFLKEVAKQTLQLKNITKIGSFIDILKENVTTNITNWSIVKSYLPYAIKFNTEDIQMENIPGDAGSFGPSSLSFFVHDEKKTKEMIDKMFEEQNGSEQDTNQIQNNTSTELSKTTENTVNKSSDNTVSDKSNSNIKVELLNGSGDSKLLIQATEKLKKESYNVYKTGTTTSTNKTTIINKKAIPSDLIEKIKDALGGGIVSNSMSSASTVDVTIILGKDYK